MGAGALGPGAGGRLDGRTDHRRYGLEVQAPRRAHSGAGSRRDDLTVHARGEPGAAADAGLREPGASVSDVQHQHFAAGSRGDLRAATEAVSADVAAYQRALDPGLMSGQAVTSAAYIPT